jgi:membrane fusion protein (multidrug efflux system)
MADRDPQIEIDTASPAPAPAQMAAPATLAEKPRRNWAKLAAMVSVPLLMGGGVAWYFYANAHYVSTDNAYISQDKVSISAELTGRVVAVGVRENQHVNAGDLLFRIDPQPYKIAVQQAEAAIAAADVKVVGMETDLSTKGADIATARASLAYAQEQYNREAELMRRGFSTRARMDALTQGMAAARGALANAEGEATKARAALATSQIAPGVNPAVLAAQVQKAQAQYNLSRTEVRAPVSGVVSKADRLLDGQMMMSGLPAVTIVVSDKSWIDANFKETDLDHMRVGQPAEIEVDAYPGMKLKGHVASIGGGTGSEFSVLPAQNATGNWVKVTQRVPVRIAIDTRPGRPLIAGLSTHVTIDTATSPAKR